MSDETNYVELSDSFDEDTDSSNERDESTQLQEFSEGDYVSHDEHGQGVVVSVMDESFEFPTGTGDDADTKKVQASSDNVKYVVALLSGGIATADADELESIGGLDGDGPSVDADEAASKSGEAELSEWYVGKTEAELLRLPGSDDPEIGFENLPDDWTRKSVLDGWASLGGTWRSAYAKMLTHFGPRRAKRLASAWKDESLQTEEWRGEF